MLHGRIIRDQRKFPEAAAEFYKATEMRPDSAQAWSELASMSIVWRKIIQPPSMRWIALRRSTPKSPAMFLLRAIVLDKIRDRKPALACYQRFLAMSNGQFPDEEFKARQRVRILENELHK